MEAPDQEKLRKASVFFLRFLAAGLVFRAAVSLLPTFMPLQNFYAAATFRTLDLMQLPATREGIDVFLGDWFRITVDCTGWKSVAALLGLSFGSKSYDARRIGIGVAALLLLNLVRILTVILLDYSGIASFSLTHGFLWRWGLTAFVLVFWVKALEKNL